jgi:predicted DNA-binding protein with PD1-like motif
MRGAPAGASSQKEYSMRFRLLEERPKTYAVIFSTGEELAAGLKQFAADQKLSGSSFQAIGAFSSVKLGWFDWETKKYRPSVALDEQVELVSLVGDIALFEGKPQVHAHVVVAKSDGTAHGGHLMEAHVRPTCEVVLVESPRILHKEIDPESGLPLIKP